jgi:hypothetical protein
MFDSFTYPRFMVITDTDMTSLVPIVALSVMSEGDWR